MDDLQFLSVIMPAQRRRELAADVLAEAVTVADHEPPSRSCFVVNGRKGWRYNASAMIEICQWVLEASDAQLDLIGELGNANALMDATVFQSEKAFTH